MAIAKRCGINLEIVAKWRKSGVVSDAETGKWDLIQ